MITVAEALLGQCVYVAEWDDVSGRVMLRANTPGPAGSLVVQFGDVTVALDAADPRMVNFVDLDVDGGLAAPRLDLMRRLVGAAVADVIPDLIANTSGAPRRIGLTGGARERPVDSRMARLVTLLAGASAPGLLYEEGALATLEALLAARRADLLREIPDGEDRMVLAARAVADRGEALVTRLGPQSRTLAADVVDDASTLLFGALGEALRRVAADLRSRLPSVPSAAPDSASKGNLEEVPFEVLPDSLSLAIAQRLPTVVRRSNDEYEVRLDGWSGRANGWWVRGFRTGGQIPLAAVPMVDVDGDAVARLLLPTRDGANFELDIVDEPGSARPSAQLAAFRAAIASGQRAARLTRLDRRSEAVHAWQLSSDLHLAAGDEDRSRQADAIVREERASSLARPSLQLAPTLADWCMPAS